MPDTSARVLFSAGLQSAYNGISVKNANTIYFTTDTRRIYIGDTEYSRPVAYGAQLPSGYMPPNSLFYNTTSSTLYFSQDGTGWTPCSNFYTHPSFTDRVLGPSADATLTFGGTFTVPGITVNEEGHVSAGEDHTMTMPTISVSGNDSAGNVISSVAVAGGVITVTKATVATSEGLQELTNRVGTLETEMDAVQSDKANLSGATFTGDVAFTAGATVASVGSGDTAIVNKAYVTQQIGNITQFAVDSNEGSGYASLEALKQAHPTGKIGTFYLVQNDGGGDSTYLEYFWTGTDYELAGAFGSVDTSDFVTKVEGATANNIAILQADGTIADGGANIASLAKQSDLDSLESEVETLTTTVDGKITAPAGPSVGQVLTYRGGSWVAETPVETDTTYTFADGANGSFTVTPLNGSAQTVSIGKPATAGTADKATSDGAGNNIVDTYATKTELANAALVWQSF